MACGGGGRTESLTRLGDCKEEEAASGHGGPDTDYGHGVARLVLMLQEGDKIPRHPDFSVDWSRDADDTDTWSLDSPVWKLLPEAIVDIVVKLIPPNSKGRLRLRQVCKRWQRLLKTTLICSICKEERRMGGSSFYFQLPHAKRWQMDEDSGVFCLAADGDLTNRTGIYLISPAADRWMELPAPGIPDTVCLDRWHLKLFVHHRGGTDPWPWCQYDVLLIGKTRDNGIIAKVFESKYKEWYCYSRRPDWRGMHIPHSPKQVALACANMFASRGANGSTLWYVLRNDGTQLWASWSDPEVMEEDTVGYFYKYPSLYMLGTFRKDGHMIFGFWKEEELSSAEDHPLGYMGGWIPVSGCTDIRIPRWFQKTSNILIVQGDESTFTMVFNFDDNSWHQIRPAVDCGDVLFEARLDIPL